MHRKHFSLSFMVALLLAASLHAIVAAADHTSQLPPADLCMIAPLSIEELREAYDEGLSASSPFENVVLTDWDAITNPGTEEQRAEIERTMLELLACSNSGNYLRFYALFTAAYLRQGGINSSWVTEQVVPQPVEQQVRFVGVVHPLQFDDGRIGAVVMVDDPAAPAPIEASFLFFAYEDGRWRFDGALPEYSLTVG